MTNRKIPSPFIDTYLPVARSCCTGSLPRSWCVPASVACERHIHLCAQLVAVTPLALGHIARAIIVL